MVRAGFRVVTGLVLVSIAALAAGCKTGSAGKLPTTLPVYQFQPPEAEEVFPDMAEQDSDADKD